MNLFVIVSLLFHIWLWLRFFYFYSIYAWWILSTLTNDLQLLFKIIILSCYDCYFYCMIYRSQTPSWNLNFTSKSTTKSKQFTATEFHIFFIQNNFDWLVMNIFRIFTLITGKQNWQFLSVHYPCVSYKIFNLSKMVREKIDLK